jgi:pilus assembly protein Flp/PilA
MKWSQRIATFLVQEDGPTAVEYAILLALLVGMMLASVAYLGEGARQVNETVAEGLEGALNN